MEFSVLLSLYYKENPAFLEACFESINNQTLKASEVVLVIDGQIGTELEETVDKWTRILPLRLLRLPVNVGLGEALNKGLSVCSNEIVFRMDTDDICCIDRFSMQAEAFSIDEELNLVGGHIDEYDENMNVFLGERRVPVGYEYIKRKVLLRSPFNHMTVAFKKTAVLQVGGYKHHLHMEDYNLWLRLIAAGYKVNNLDKVLVKARTGSSMLHRRKGMSYVKSEFILFKLKCALKLQNYYNGFLVFVARSFPRVLPVSLLRVIYKMLRK